MEAATDLPLILDAMDAKSLAIALRFCTRKPVLNMATAEPERLNAMLDLARAHNTRLIAACIERHAPPDASGRLELAAFIAARAAGYGITGERLIIDPMVMPLALPDGERHAKAVLETLGSLGQIIDPAPSSLIALSNLTTRTAGRDAGLAGGPFMAAAFGAGLKICMLDVLDKELMKTAALLRVFSGKRLFAPAEYDDL